MTKEDDIATTYAQHEANLRKATEVNKVAVFEVLAAANITSVIAIFDGEGDSGGIESIVAIVGDTHADLPADSLRYQRAKFGAEKLVVREQTLREAIEELCYDYLAQEHGGWENDDGAYGTFGFNVAACTIELTFNGRFTDVYTSIHEL